MPRVRLLDYKLVVFFIFLQNDSIAFLGESVPIGSVGVIQFICIFASIWWYPLVFVQRYVTAALVCVSLIARGVGHLVMCSLARHWVFPGMWPRVFLWCLTIVGWLCFCLPSLPLGHLAAESGLLFGLVLLFFSYLYLFVFLGCQKFSSIPWILQKVHGNWNEKLSLFGAKNLKSIGNIFIIFIFRETVSETPFPSISVYLESCYVSFLVILFFPPLIKTCKVDWNLLIWKSGQWWRRDRDRDIHLLDQKKAKSPDCLELPCRWHPPPSQAH